MHASLVSVNKRGIEMPGVCLTTRRLHGPDFGTVSSLDRHLLISVV